MSEDAKRASTETLRNAATAAPGEKVASLESADGAESVRAYDEDEIAHTVPCWRDITRPVDFPRSSSTVPRA